MTEPDETTELSAALQEISGVGEETAQAIIDVVEAHDIPQSTRNLAEWNGDIPALLYRPTGLAAGVVLNTANEPPTAYQVDAAELHCDCLYMEKQADAGRVCKHLAIAIAEHPRYGDMPTLAHRDLSVLVDRAAAVVRQLESAPIGTGQPSTGPEADAGTGDSTGELDPVSALEAELEANGVPAGHIDIWVHDDYGSLNFDIDERLEDDEWDAYLKWTRETDGVVYDQNKQINYIRKDDIAEVLG